MSYSGGGSARSFGNRGSAPKKDKKKKQDFHKHHVKFTQEEHVSLEQMKERTSIGLKKLGNQVFSSEPGGYGFQNWMTSFNLLLDDFEQKCKPAALPKEYYDARMKLTAKLLEPVDTSELDSQMTHLEDEIRSTEEKIAGTVEKSEKAAFEDWHRDEQKLSHLRKERTQTDLDITETKSELENEKKKLASQSVFKRLFSGSDALKALQVKVDSLNERRGSIDAEMRSLEEDRLRKQSEVKESEKEISNMRAALDELRTRLGELDTKKQEMLQISEKRSTVTNEMSEMISTLRTAEQNSPVDEMPQK